MLIADFDRVSGKLKGLEGNRCKKGIKFAEKELINPVRILTTTISIASKRAERLPVRSSTPAPKAKIQKMVSEIKKIKVSPPIKMGDIITANFLNTGVDIISSITLDE